MKNRIDALKNYLKEIVKLDTENFRIYVEDGKAEAVFNSDDQFLFQTDPVGQVLGITPTTPTESFHMVNEYKLSLHIKSYGGDYDALIRLVLFWLNDHMQGIKVNYVLEDNNTDTVDIWFDMDIREGSKNDDEGGVHVC